MTATHLIFGCGYLGQRVAKRWQEAGLRVAAVTRKAQRAAELAALKIEPIVADVTDPASLQGLPAAEVVLFAVGFDRRAGKAIEDVYVDGLANVLEAIPTPRRFIYISSTGVYGQTDGSWVDENSPCHPTRAGGRACLAAEQRLAASPLADRSVILRCAGLYGPGRIPRLTDIQQKKPIAANPDAVLNLIHIDDAANIICHVADSAFCNPQSVIHAPRVYLVSDGHPVIRRDFYQELARLLNQPEPTFETPTADGRRASGDNKRISNRRLLEETDITLQYPDYLAGLAAIVAGDD